MRAIKIGLVFIVGLFLQKCTPKKQNIVIFSIGDSTMANKKVENFPETGWCQVLEEYFDSSVTVRNHAKNGRSSKNFIDEGRWNAVLDSLKSGDFVFIQFGHNDQKEYDSTRYTTPFGTYTDNLEKFVNETRQKGAVPILFTSIVRRKFEGNKELVDTHGNYPVVTRKLAKSMDVYLIDMQKLTEDWVNSLGDELSKEMYLWTEPNAKYPEGRKDDTHLSKKGAHQVVQLALNECIKQELPFFGKIYFSEKQ